MQIPTTHEVLTDPTASRWLKDSLRSALDRDAVDAVNDAEVLTQILRNRLEAIQYVWAQLGRN
jgi:hypothetical protein